MAGDSATNQTSASKFEMPQGWDIFVMGNYQNLEIDNTSDAMGGKDNALGVTFGVDAHVRDDLVVGVAFNAFRADIDLNGGGTANMEGYKGSLFATWFKDNFHVDAAAGVGLDRYNSLERAGLGGVAPDGTPLIGKATGDTTGQEFDGLLSGGYDIKMEKFTLTPNAGLNYTALSIDGYTENGSLAPLKIDKIDASSLQSSLGATLTYDTKFDSMPVTPELGVYWRHELLDDNYNIDSQLASGAGSPFRVESAKMGRDSVPVWLGVNVQVTKRVGLHLTGETALFRDSGHEYSVMVGIDCAL